MKRMPYSVTVLRYVHDVASGEFVNVGLMMVCGQSFLEFSVLKRAKRVLQFFPGSRATTIRIALRTAKTAYSQVKKAWSVGVVQLTERADPIEDLSKRVVPYDDSGLQWSPVTVGLTSDPQSTFDRLFERLVLRYEDGAAQQRRTDDQVWRTFSKKLENRSVFSHLEEHQVTSKLETVTFEHALKNGKWHLLEPVSFDLASPESVTDKAKRLLGEMTLLSERKDEFKLYFLVGAPNDDEVRDAYEKALRILKEVPCESAIFRESQADQFASEIARVASN